MRKELHNLAKDTCLKCTFLFLLVVHLLSVPHYFLSRSVLLVFKFCVLLRFCSLSRQFCETLSTLQKLGDGFINLMCYYDI